MYMFTQNFIQLRAAVHELSCKQRENLATMLKTTLPSLPETVKIEILSIGISEICSCLSEYWKFLPPPTNLFNPRRRWLPERRKQWVYRLKVSKGTCAQGAAECYGSLTDRHRACRTLSTRSVFLSLLLHEMPLFFNHDISVTAFTFVSWSDKHPEASISLHSWGGHTVANQPPPHYSPPLM